MVIQNKLSFPNAVLLTVGAMVGSAIFSLSGITIALTGAGALLAWLLAGVILLSYGLLVAYLAHRWPQTGGMFFFPSKALGFSDASRKVIGAVSAWIYFAGCLAGVAFSAQYIGIYFAMLFPNLPSSFSTVISVVSVVVALLINWLKVRKMGIFNGGLTIVLIVILLVYVVFCIFSPEFSINYIISETSLSSDFSTNWSTVQIAMVAYGSIVAPAFMVGRLTNVNQVYKVQIVAMIAVILLYLLAIFATVGIVNQTDFLANPGAEYTPFDLAISKAGLPVVLGVLINVAAIFALFTTEVVVMDLAVISVEVTASERTFPKLFATRHNSLLSVAAVVLVVALIPNVTDAIVNIGATFNSIFIGIIVLSTIVAVFRKL